MFKPGYSLGSPLFYNTELNKFILFRETMVGENSLKLFKKSTLLYI